MTRGRTLVRPEWTTMPSSGITPTEWLPVQQEALLSAKRTYDVRAYDAGGLVTGDGLVGAAAAAAANGGGVITMPPGHHQINKGVRLENNVHLIAPGATLDFTTMEYAHRIEQSCIYASGSYTLLPALSGGYSAGSNTFTFASDPGLEPFDLVMIHDETDGGFVSSRPEYQEGEFLRVYSVSGNTVVFETPLFAAYPAANPIKVYKVNPVTTSIRGVKIVGRPLARPVWLDWTDGARIIDCEFTGPTEHAQLYISHAYDSTITNVKTHAITAAITTSQYGIAIGNSQKMTVTNVVCDAMRHGITTGGAPGVGAIPCRDIVIGDSIIGGHGKAPELAVLVNGFSLHGNAEYITIQNCIFTNGASLSGDNISFIGNTVRMTAGQAPILMGGEAKGANFNISNNTIYATNKTKDNTLSVVHWRPSDALVRNGTLRIIDNKIELGAYKNTDGSTVAVHVRNTAATATGIRVEVRGNEIVCAGGWAAGDSSTAIYIGSGTGKRFEYVSVEGNSIRRGSIRVTRVSYEQLIVRGNRIVDSPSYGIYIDGSGANFTTMVHSLVDDNYIWQSGMTPIMVTTITGGRVFIKRNHTIGGNIINSSSATEGAAIAVATANLAQVEENYIQNVGGRLTNGIAFSGVTTAFQRNNERDGIGADSQVSVTTYHIDEAKVGAPPAAAANGSIYRNRSGGAGTTLYVREGGAWVAK